jgi:hypothetical protein
MEFIGKWIEDIKACAQVVMGTGAQDSIMLECVCRWQRWVGRELMWMVELIPVRALRPKTIELLMAKVSVLHHDIAGRS